MKLGRTSLLIAYLFLVGSEISLSATLNKNISPTIIQKPIVFDETRKALTLAYQNEHYGNKNPTLNIDPKMIVIHWTALHNLEDSFRAFAASTLDTRKRPDIEKNSSLNTSAHYLVDRDGTIYQLMPDNWMGRHVIGLNEIAIGIENVGAAPTLPLTPQQLEANVKLVQYLTKKYPHIRYLIGHYEYKAFKNTALWQEKDPRYLTPKSDPGKNFMQALRAKLANLGLQGATEIVHQHN